MCYNLYIDTKIKVLLLNLGYESGLNGSWYDYVVHVLRYLHTPTEITKEVDEVLENMILREQPDICCFLEIHSNTALVKDLRQYSEHNISNKYGLHSLLRWLPFFSDNCNGFFCKKEVPYRKLYFRHGAKKLIYELEVADDLSLIMCHFSLTHIQRAEQFAELEAIIKKRKRVIIGGDFNIFGGTKELQKLMLDCNLKLMNNKATFPAVHPNKTFDLFLASENVKITRCETVNNFRGSDHLPVILELKV